MVKCYAAVRLKAHEDNIRHYSLSPTDLSLACVLFRSRYNNNRSEIVFLAISDDYNWIKVGDDGKAFIDITF